MNNIQNGFIGTFSGFTGTAAATMAANQLVWLGTIPGVTHQAFAAGEKYIAFTGAPVSVYSLPLTEAAASTSTAGTKIYATTDGEVTTTATGNTLLGFLWKPIAAGDTYACVALNGPAVSA